VISILAAMGLVQYRNSVVSAREATLKTDLFRMRDAIDQYYADKTKYPSSLDSLVSDGYLRKVPEDPITKSSDTLADRAGRARPEQPSRRGGRLRRQERRAGHRARRHQLFGVVTRRHRAVLVHVTSNRSQGASPDAPFLRCGQAADYTDSHDSRNKGIRVLRAIRGFPLIQARMGEATGFHR
jgi:hypothetical protein